jgi:hypothetical protein
MTATVHGWCGFVEKSNDVVFQQMLLNKLWIPDDMINEIKDYLYISAAEVLRKFYRAHLNTSITDMWVNYRPLTDVYGRDRQVVYSIGHVYGAGNIQIQGCVCVTCGDFDHLHNNMNGCCPHLFDLEDEPIYLVDNYWGPHDQEITDETIAEINAEAEANEPETIPEVTWEIDIPTAAKAVDFASDEYRQLVLDNWRHSSVDDWSDEEEYYADMAADYAAHMEEVRMEEYADRMEEYADRR